MGESGYYVHLVGQDAMRFTDILTKALLFQEREAKSRTQHEFTYQGRRYVGVRISFEELEIIKRFQEKHAFSIEIFLFDEFKGKIQSSIYRSHLQTPIWFLTPLSVVQELKNFS